MNIVLTGASGFIGGAFLRRFANVPGLSLCGVGRRSVRDLPASVRYYNLPLDRLGEINVAPDVVIHAAGRASPWGTAREYYCDNVQTTERVIDFCLARGLPRLIFLSTAAVYYRFAHQYHLTEDAIVGPAFTSEYGRSKYLAEQRVGQYSGEKTIFRPCGVFGAGDKLLFPPLLDAARKKRLINLHSESPAQAELLSVDILCDYLLQAATAPQVKPCYNISAAHPVATRDLLHEVLSRLDLPPPTRTLSATAALRFAGALEWCWRKLLLPGEPPITRFGIGVFSYSAVLDVSRMLADFGAPKVAFDDCLSQFLQQYKAQQ